MEGILSPGNFAETIKVINNIHVTDSTTREEFQPLYDAAVRTIEEYVAILQNPETPLPPQGPIKKDQEYVSNIGREGYEAHVNKLKEHITKGDIIQAVPSQRFSRPTSLYGTRNGMRDDPPVLRLHQQLGGCTDELEVLAVNVEEVGIEIKWTTNLEDHLRLVDDDRAVFIFRGANFLQFQNR